MQASNSTESDIAKEKYAATQEWIESLQSEPDESDLSTCYDGDSSIVESDTDTDIDGNTVDVKTLGLQVAPSEILSVKELLNTINSLNTNSVQTVGNVNIENSTGVHIGNVTNFNGNIQIIHTSGSCDARRSLKNRRSRTSPRLQRRDVTATKNDGEEYEEHVPLDAFINSAKFKIPRELCAILPRSTWLAQRPMEAYTHLKEPVQYVVISHTATESSEKQAVNIGIVRDIQCFHIETRGWNDIAYNFLIGCDGNIYEGRGWSVVGAHTLGYNVCSIGISFIGCFMRELPTKVALTACQNLLKRGVEKGHLAEDYRLVTHAQCRSTESPGRKLFEELQTWEHFYKIEDEEE